ncbi:MAG: hypothetical protein KC550_04220 [Nanoarchaeota archaeon]|nr:hypothetical protein [Nanoarchaeota archaeon]
MLVISQRNSFNGPSPYFANLLLSSPSAEFNDLVVSELLCENKLDFNLANRIMHSKIIGENLEACKINFFGNDSNSSPLGVLRKIYESNLLENFVKNNNFSWNHEAWEQLLVDIKKEKIYIPDEFIGKILENMKEENKK